MRDLSLEELAGELGVSAGQIQKYESGANRASASALFALAQFFEKDIRFFYEGLETRPASRLIRG